jgi:hypothetical protein
MQTRCAGFSKTGTRYQINAEGRTPSTEDRARPLENAHTGYAGIDGQGSDYLVPGTGYLAPVPHSHIVLPDCPRPDDCKNTLFTGAVTTPIRPWSVFQGVRPWRVCRPLCR